MNDAEAEVNDNNMSCCASCGVKEDDGIPLKKCNGCHLVKYCGIECQRNHRPNHKRECKRRAAELRDEILFKQPDSIDCPICCLPMPSDWRVSGTMTCCCKMICQGCNYANKKQALKEKSHPLCSFCRHPIPKTQEEIDQNLKKRIGADDPNALYVFGWMNQEKGNYEGAIENFSKAAASFGLVVG